MQSQKPARLLIGCFFVAICAFAVGYAYLETSSVRIINLSNVPISGIRVKLGGKDFWSGSLDPGESHKAFAAVENDGYIDVVFNNGSVVHEQTFAHVTTYHRDHHQLTITPEFKIECTSAVAKCVDLTEQRSNPK